MRLVHYSSNIVTKVRGRHQRSDFTSEERMAGIGKPRGFWVSDEASGAYGWRKWCQDNGFRSYAMRYEHEVVLAPDAKILYIRTPEELNKFAKRYHLKEGILYEIGLKVHRDMKRRGTAWDMPPDIKEINWHRVAKRYHGIVITPYIWQHRLGQHFWYYGWDCASGCIWNAKAIESITMVRERKVPRKPTYWQMRRAQKRQRIRMAEASKRMVAEMQKTRPPTVLDEQLVKSADAVIADSGGST